VERQVKRTRSSEVAAVFENYPANLAEKLIALRQLIFDTARRTKGVGELEETLKWGQPSYVTTKSKSGSTIRIDSVKSRPGHYAIYFHCQTTLVETFRRLYPREFKYEGDRSILFHEADAVDWDALSHCISLALTYHLAKKRSNRASRDARSRPKRGSS
jgi:hypothetical protein